MVVRRVFSQRYLCTLCTVIVSIRSLLGNSRSGTNLIGAASNQRDFREVCARINSFFTGRKRVYIDIVGTHSV